MLMGGTADVNVFLENNEIAFNQIVNAPVVYRVDIIGANHTHFANVCQIGDFLIDSSASVRTSGRSSRRTSSSRTRLRVVQTCFPSKRPIVCRTYTPWRSSGDTSSETRATTRLPHHRVRRHRAGDQLPEEVVSGSLVPVPFLADVDSAARRCASASS